jgi:signal transduction histidine kinase/PAS domain-containing protein
MALAVSRRPTAEEMDLWARLARSLGSVIARLERDAARVAAAAAAARDRALLSDVFEHLPDAIVITDAENRVAIENERARALLRTPEEGASEGLRRATELNTLLMSSFLSRAVLQGTVAGESRDVTLVNPVDGSDLTFEVLSVRLTGRREREPLTVSLLRNVTDLKRVTEALTAQFARARDAEREIRSERDRLEIILENVADPVVVTDMAAGVLLMNRAAERLFQAPEEPGPLVAERSAASFSVRANDTIFTSYISDFALDPDETRRTTFRLMDPARKTDFPVEAIAGKVMNERGEPIAIVTVVHDLSVAEEKEKLASQLLVLNRDLEARVAEATSELEERNRRLELQRDELRRASQLKSEFLASMSHELRTPLNAIIGHTQNILDGLYGQLAPQVQIISRRIEQNSKHLLMLINDILDLAKIEAGEMPMTIEEVDLLPLVEEVLRTLEPMAQRRTLSLALEPSASRARIRSDEMKLRQILTNLGSNAVKFTIKGGVRVRVVDIEAGVSITIEDTGIGIPRDLIATAFQDFRQLDQSYTRQEGGTGLGLSITRRLVGLLGGRLFVRSAPGVGSHFRVELPIFPGQTPRHEGDVLVIEDGPVSPAASASSSAKGA